MSASKAARSTCWRYGQREPLVLLHGGTWCALWLLSRFLGHLDGVRVIAPDRPGWGLSAPVKLPVDRYDEAAVDWLEGLFDALGLDSATVVDHPAGGAWALWFAVRRPQRVNGLGA